MKKIKEVKGITLVALVITIIVLLILSVVTINLTLGERGIFNIAQKAAKNYTDAAEKEEIELANFQNEVDNTLNGLGSGVVTKPEEPKQNWSDITAANYGDYVNYPVTNGSTEKGYTTDWRIFYKDNDGYVYLIASYLLKYSDLPAETNLQTSEKGPYVAHWPMSSRPNNISNISDDIYTRYKMSFTGRSTINMYCVSRLMNTSVWSKFVNTTYAVDAIGAPTLEMWVDSWNAKGNTKLYYNNTNSNGYYVGTNSEAKNVVIDGLSTNDSLYFLNKNENYWLASPSAEGDTRLVYADKSGRVAYAHHDWELSVRPLVRLKNTVNAQKVNGVWELK